MVWCIVFGCISDFAGRGSVLGVLNELNLLSCFFAFDSARGVARVSFSVASTSSSSLTESSCGTFGSGLLTSVYRDMSA